VEVYESVWVVSSVTVDAPPAIDTIDVKVTVEAAGQVVKVTVDTAGQVVGDGDGELVLLLEVLNVDGLDVVELDVAEVDLVELDVVELDFVMLPVIEPDVAVAKQEQALEIRDGR
jgi:hypothetical protein